jgi:hypothetical protein
MELLSESLEHMLLDQPESGMGFQFVEAELKNGERQKGTVFNAEYFLRRSESPRLLRDIEEPSRRLLLIEQKELGLGDEIESVRVIAGQVLEQGRVAESAKDTGAAADAEEENLGAPEKFKRFSAFKNDRRMTANGGLLPGSYATTDSDAQKVKTGSDAVRRYALPNPTPAVFVFTIGAPSGTLLKRGIVQPAFGQPGGGVEILFTKGTPANTVTGPSQIPP